MQGRRKVQCEYISEQSFGKATSIEERGFARYSERAFLRLQGGRFIAVNRGGTTDIIRPLHILCGGRFVFTAHKNGGKYDYYGFS